MKDYLVEFNGDWSANDLAIAEQGILKLSNVLSEISKLPPHIAFNCLVKRKITFNVKLDVPGNFRAYVKPGVVDQIDVQIGDFTVETVIHDIAHIADNNEPRYKRPAYLLARYGIKDENGRMVTGSGRGGYSRNMGLHKNGYKIYEFPWLQHPPWWIKGNNEFEDFCDILLALVIGNFADNPAGRALYNWIVNYLKVRLSKCIEN